MSASSDTYGTYKMSTRANAYYARNRWYDSAMGRFTTPDPYAASATLTNPNSWNRYAYVGGDPVNFNDPSGLFMRVPDPISPIDPYIQAFILGWTKNGSERRVRRINEVEQEIARMARLSNARVARTTRLLNTAIQDALAALEDPDCAGLFGVQGDALDPRDVLKGLASGQSGYGYFLVSEIKQVKSSAVTNAQTEPQFGYATSPAGTLVNTGINGVVITINTAPNTPFNRTATPTDRATTVLHELGHAFNWLPGAGGSFVQNDQDDVTLSMENTSMVKTSCFP